ncbi:hypothetical protein [Bradyrhizobium sacchari]|uniref:hypothetical protein n=1 Tax=Bradyrhizobium sacchari TaxID=1399419 RepID=UPI001374787D|nr:hypothetical protein [Bradyrhizobium sacchari]
MSVPKTMTEAGKRLEYLSELPFDAWRLITGISVGSEEYRDWAIADAAAALR